MYTFKKPHQIHSQQPTATHTYIIYSLATANTVIIVFITLQNQSAPSQMTIANTYIFSKKLTSFIPNSQHARICRGDRPGRDIAWEGHACDHCRVCRSVVLLQQHISIHQYAINMHVKIGNLLYNDMNLTTAGSADVLFSCNNRPCRCATIDPADVLFSCNNTFLVQKCVQYIFRYIVIWDGALWFWSVIKTIMTDFRYTPWEAQSVYYTSKPECVTRATTDRRRVSQSWLFLWHFKTRVRHPSQMTMRRVGLLDYIFKSQVRSWAVMV